MQKKAIQRLVQYYRCPERFAQFTSPERLSHANGWFRFGENAICYGKCCGDQQQELPRGELQDALRKAVIQGGFVHLPFDPSEAADNLLLETYVDDWRKARETSFLADLYYFVRPVLPVGVRRLFQKIYLAGWEGIPFPRWPVDLSIDALYRELLVVLLKSTADKEIPFIWFWPNGASACSVMTHDVETEAGCRFSRTLMDIDDSFGIKSSFQIIPEKRYPVPSELFDVIRKRGFEVAVHDLNHDGHLYENREQFLRRAQRINAYGKELGTGGFRSGSLYRRQVWFDALDFSYDMSVPNVAHLDPQRGGCCTVMPYFIGEILEIPVTTTQDYSLFYILNDYSNSLWSRQIELIMADHGLASFIIHPDYVVRDREQGVYRDLLSSLDHLRRTRGVWITTPAELNSWWRQRAGMRLVEGDGTWCIEGEGRDRAQIAFASLKDGKLSLRFHLEEDQREDTRSVGASGAQRLTSAAKSRREASPC